MCAFIKSRLDKKRRKHTRVATVASTKLSITYLISHALEDGHISTEEFKLVVVEFERYNALKAAARKPTPVELSSPENQKKRRRNAPRTWANIGETGGGAGGAAGHRRRTGWALTISFNHKLENDLPPT